MAKSWRNRQTRIAFANEIRALADVVENEPERVLEANLHVESDDVALPIRNVLSVTVKPREGKDMTT